MLGPLELFVLYSVLLCAFWFLERACSQTRASFGFETSDQGSRQGHCRFFSKGSKKAGRTSYVFGVDIHTMFSLRDSAHSCHAWCGKIHMYTRINSFSYLNFFKSIINCFTSEGISNVRAGRSAPINPMLTIGVAPVLRGHEHFLGSNTSSAVLQYSIGSLFLCVRMQSHVVPQHYQKIKQKPVAHLSGKCVANRTYNNIMRREMTYRNAMYSRTAKNERQHSIDCAVQNDGRPTRAKRRPDRVLKVRIAVRICFGPRTQLHIAVRSCVAPRTLPVQSTIGTTKGTAFRLRCRTGAKVLRGTVFSLHHGHILALTLEIARLCHWEGASSPPHTPALRALAFSIPDVQSDGFSDLPQRSPILSEKVRTSQGVVPANKASKISFRQPIPRPSVGIGCGWHHTKFTSQTFRRFTAFCRSLSSPLNPGLFCSYIVQNWHIVRRSEALIQTFGIAMIFPPTPTCELPADIIWWTIS